MSQANDSTAAMPESTSTPDANLGAAIDSFMNGTPMPESSYEKEAFAPEAVTPKASSLDSLEIAHDTKGKEPVSGEPEAPASTDNVPELELKVKGYKELQKVRLDPNDDNTKELLGKGLRFDKAMADLARQRKDLETKLAKFQDYEDKAAEADKISTARQLMEQGYHEQAMAALLGETSEDVINNLIEERIRYQNASPEERLEIDLERQRRNEQLQRQKDADRIAALEAQINARSEQVQEAEFTGYIQDARSRYDIGQWVDDIDAAESYNDMVHNAAMADIIKLQRQREANGGDNITQRDIQRAYATRAKIFIDNFQRQSQKMADEKVSAQSEVAKQNAQVASTKNYGQPDPISDWQKSGGKMSDLVDLFNRGGRGTL